MWHSDRSLVVSFMRGFTLLELLTVLLLIGFLLGIGLRLDTGLAHDTPREELELLASQFTLANLEAVQAGSVWGLDFYREGGQNGYRWLVHDGERWLEADADVVDAKAATYSWPSEISAELIVDGVAVVPTALQSLDHTEGNANVVPEILLLPTRENSPFMLALHSQTAEKQSATLSIDALGRASLEAADAEQ